MANYTLRVIQNGQTKTAVLRDNQNGRIPTEANTEYRLYNEQGELVTYPVTERSGDDLLVFANGKKDGTPEFVLLDYFNKSPVLNADYVAEIGNSLMTNDNAAVLAPVAESSTWVKAATVAAAAVVGGAIWAVAKKDDHEGNPDLRIKGKNPTNNDTTNTNPNTETTNTSTNTNQPNITINKIADIQKSAVADEYTISGSLKGLKDGDTATVWVSLNGKTAKTATVEGDTWKLTIKGSELAAEPVNSVAATLSVTDKNGNPVNAKQISTQTTYKVLDKVAETPSDTPSQPNNETDNANGDALNKPSITINRIDTITTKEGTTKISGSLNLNNEGLTNEAVWLNVGNDGVSSLPATISADKKSWSIDVPNSVLAHAEGNITIQARVEIAKGNQTASANNHENTDNPVSATNPSNVYQYSVDAVLGTPTITIKDVKNIDESKIAEKYTLSGSLGNIDANAKNVTVTVNVNGKDKTATVDLNTKTWKLDVAGTDLASKAGKNFKVTATVAVEDNLGRTASKSAEDTYNVIAKPVALLNKPEITVHTIEPITKTDLAKNGTTTISGSLNLNNDGLSSEKVILSINGKDYPAQIAANKQSWSAAVPTQDLAAKQGNNAVSAQVDIAKGTQTQTADSNEQPQVLDTKNPKNNVSSFTVDTEIATPTIKINDVKDMEQGKISSTYKISGTLNNIAEAKTVVVKVNVNGAEKDAEVDLAKKTWSVNVSGSELASKVGNNFAVKATATATDAVGNTATSKTVTDTYNVTAAKPVETVKPSITIDKITQDEIALINKLIGANQSKEITGKLAGIPAGATPVVDVTVAGKAYTAKISGSTWSVSVPKSALTERGAKEVVAKLTVNGASDNATATFYVIDPNITIDRQDIRITQDNLDGTTTLTGTYDVDGADKRKVLVQIGKKSSTGTGLEEPVAKEFSSEDTDNPVILNDDNTWTITISNKDLAYEMGDADTLQVGAKVEFTEGGQSGNQFTGMGYTSDVVAPQAFVVSGLIDEAMPVTNYVIGKTTEINGDESVSGSDNVADTFVFSKMLDGGITTIDNFDVNADRVQLSSEVFTALSSTMQDFADYVKYDAATGALSYDADGAGAGAAVQFAQLDKDLPIEQNHFIIG